MALEDLSDFELAELGEALFDELRRRALACYDPSTLADEAFTTFDSRGNAPDPVIVGELLICCGSLKGRPAGHRCSFTSVSDQWAWEHGHLHDELRWVDEGNLRTVTILVAQPRLVVTQVESTCDHAGHHRKAASSWKISRGRLEPTATPSRTPVEHGR